MVCVYTLHTVSRGVHDTAGSVNVIFSVVDFNDCPPTFVNPPRFLSLPEDVNINSLITTYTVQDCDSGLNGVNGTRFSIIAGESQEGSGPVLEVSQ